MTRKKPQTPATPKTASREALTEELLDEIVSWNPRERFRMLGAWRDCGVSLAQANVITMLEMGGPLSMGRVAELLGVSVASATGIVDRMAERGLIERHASETDRRVVEVHIGQAARDLFAEFRERRRAHLRAVLERVDARRLEGLLDGLRAVKAARMEVDREQLDAHQGLLVYRASGIDA